MAGPSDLRARRAAAASYTIAGVVAAQLAARFERAGIKPSNAG